MIIRKITLVLMTAILAVSYCQAEECCGNEPLPANKLCCNDAPYDPLPYNQGDVTIDFQAIINLVQQAATASGQCQSNGPGGGSTIKYTHEDIDICCDDVLKTTFTDAGGGTVSVGSFACDIPAPWTVPGIQWGVTIGVSGDISAAVSATGTCDDDEYNYCVDVNLAASLTGGFFFEIVDDDVLRATATVTGTVTGTGMEWCADSGLDAGQVCVTATIEGTATFFTVASITIEGTVYDSCA